MEWPDRDPEEAFDFVTTPTAKQIWERAARASIADIISQDNHEKIKPHLSTFLAKLHESQKWRFGYRDILNDFTKLQAMVSNEQCLDMAQAGLDACHDLFLWRLDAQTVVPAKDVFMFCSSFQKLETITLWGTKAPDIDFQFGIANPQDPHHLECNLYGMDAVAQIQAWYEYGCLETSASVLAKTTVTSPNVAAEIAKKKFVILGCTSELGPAKSLLQIPGVTLLGIARGGKRLDALIEYVTYHSPDDTKFLYPKSPGLFPNGGADLLSQGPQIAQWILDNTDENDELVLVPIAYADGEAHVRVTVAMDLIVQRVLRQRENKTTLWSYTSPATSMVVPPTAATEAQKRLAERPSYETWANSLSGGKWLEPALRVDPCNHDYCVLNGIVTAQGPNYILAKTIQQWRCMITQYRDHIHVSAPFAPATRTVSMTSHDTVSNAIEGMHHFAPMLAFDVEPASSLMCAILVAHLQLLNRSVPDYDESPFSMFWDGAVHGGVWTCPYTLESVSAINYALGKSTYYPKGYVPPEALPPQPKDENEENDKESKKIDPDVLLTLTDSNGQPMPDFVKERLDFM